MNPSDESQGLNRRDFLKGVAAGAMGVGLTGAAAGDLLAQEGKKAEEKKKPEKKKASDKVKTRKLGRTGIETSVIAYGCGGLAASHVPQLKIAHERGISFFDTAWNYGGGQSESALGEFVKTVKDREKIFISTKSSRLDLSGSWKKIYGRLEEGVARSLKKLNTDYIDVLFAPHGASSPAAVRNQALKDAMRKLKEEGLVRHFATSSHGNYAATCLAAIKDGFYDVLMPVVNVCTHNAVTQNQAPSGRRRRGRGIEDTGKMLAEAKKKNVGIIGMKVANPGFLKMQDHRQMILAPEVAKIIEKALPDSASFSTHQKLYAYMLKQEGVSSVVVGLRDVRHLKEAIAVGCAV
ncbi:MAG: aldo/keto reductase [Planctomycetota bacterium]|jgi:aryl-alcohol dehydrogenase-like predicted oxidoreductase